MPIVIPSALPAYKTLTDENIFIMGAQRAKEQDIRPIKIAILNLMPTKIETETQLLRLLGNTPLQVEITLLRTASYESKNTAKEHLGSFYTTFDKVKDKRFDGMIITGAPVENMDFEDVIYWEELKEIMDFTKTNVTSTFHICWGAQAGLYYHYGVEKFNLPKKQFGIFKHKTNEKKIQLLRGFDDEFYAPHSRHTGVKTDMILQNGRLEILAHSEAAGPYLIMGDDGKHIFATGHSEYDQYTLYGEYMRDFNKGLEVELPENYFPENDTDKAPPVIWRAHSNLLFSNWLNYYVYQQTPFVL
ncbi:homoserine O-succinyltransferase [Andreesenia angusta]|uniref:Homoserine O-acetyltransferase n=1 Tax=Andreesenia angusta TaxID=39480 RepID=A0A1S1V5G8_9FIRM|nr:homoserine O-succinyltransferase [Andreesenia angusta]OHW61744.1 homoserine O-succinyltransferase [Andreesenia angusta]